jgi:hypothetical protein
VLYSGSARVEATSSGVVRPELDGQWLNTRALFGGRYQFDDSSFLSLEYYYNGEGHSRAGFQRLASLAKTAPAQLQAALSGSADAGTPQKFSFEPMRRHYVVMQYNKPRVFDDFTLAASALISVEDLSMQLVPQVSWAPKDWLQLTLALYVPVSGVAEWGVTIGQTSYGEFSLSSLGTRVLGKLRLFF